ncbi:MAG: IS701 family transposase [Pseudonocardiaceae bacterium]
MLPMVTLPSSLMALLVVFESCFTAPSFRTFCALLAGLVVQTGPRTVCGMLLGAGYSRVWAHDRAHRFFAHTRWSVDRVGLALAELVITRLLAPDAPITVVIDDTVFRRRGRKVWAAGWFHDGAAPGKTTTGFGNTWVIVGILVRLPFLSRPVCLPVLARLVIKDTMSASRLWLATELVELLARTFSRRRIDVVADAAYAGGQLRTLPERVSWTTRPRKDAALYELAPPRTGKRGRPRLKGPRLGSLASLATSAPFTPATVTRYQTSATVAIATVCCLWYTVFGPRPARVVFLREPGTHRGYDLVLITTDLTADPGTIVERYAARWSIEVMIKDAKQLFGAGQTHTRTAAAVQRAVPFALICQTITTLWYTTAGHHPDDLTDRRADAPWYVGKSQPTTLDMIIKLRRVLITTRNRPAQPEQPTPEEIHTLRLAWDNHTA